jgi:hypothetical protein
MRMQGELKKASRICIRYDKSTRDQEGVEDVEGQKLPNQHCMRGSSGTFKAPVV